jgi:hypothetical protein
MSGSPTDGTVTLYEEEQGNPRHQGQVSGGELAATLYRDARVGAVYLRNKAGFNRQTGFSRQEEIGSGFVDLDPLRVLGVEGVSMPIYVEYATKNRPFSDWWALETADRTSHALYAGSNLVWGALGLSAEWKDYADFRLGTNDPPSLIREHSPTLLNRSTHVLDAQLEQGFQLEASWSVGAWGSVLGNFSRSDGLNADRTEERYVELHAAPRAAERWEATAFYDRGRDDVFGIVDHRTFGVATTTRFLARWSMAVDFQRQTAHRQAGPDDSRFENVFLSWTAAAAGWGSLGMIWERTTDPVDPSLPFGKTDPLHVMGWVANASLTPRHDATLFIGQRRGGRACTAGTCYEVQPFEGAELRVVSRF